MNNKDNTTDSTISLLNELKINDLHEDITQTRQAVEKLEDNFNDHRLSNSDNFRDVHFEIKSLEQQIDRVGNKIDDYNNSKFKWSSLLTKESIAIATTLALITVGVINNQQPELTQTQLETLIQLLNE